MTKIITKNAQTFLKDHLMPEGHLYYTFVRDVKMIDTLNFPVFATGMKPLDSNGRGRLTSFNKRILCGEVEVNPGDLIVADFDGVVVIPTHLIDQTIELASAKVTGENNSRAELEKGAYLRDVYNKFGVL